MKQERVERIRCTCEWCGKSNYSPAHMARHERRCTRNPGRECGFCKQAEEHPPDVGAEIIRKMLRRNGEGFPINCEQIEIAVLEWAEECPACALAAYRVADQADLSFGFGLHKERWWKMVNEEEEYSQ